MAKDRFDIQEKTTMNLLTGISYYLQLPEIHCWYYLLSLLVLAGFNVMFTGTLDSNKPVFNAWSVWHRKEWYRMLSYGLIHGG